MVLVGEGKRQWLAEHNNTGTGNETKMNEWMDASAGLEHRKRDVWNQNGREAKDATFDQTDAGQVQSVDWMDNGRVMNTTLGKLAKPLAAAKQSIRKTRRRFSPCLSTTTVQYVHLSTTRMWAELGKVGKVGR